MLKCLSKFYKELKKTKKSPTIIAGDLNILIKSN